MNDAAEAREVFELYRRYLIHEYELIQSYTNILLIANGLLVGSFGLLIQFSANAYLGHHPETSLVDIGAIPLIDPITTALATGISLAAIALNAFFARKLSYTASVVERLRVRWRELRANFGDSAAALPFLQHGTRDFGANIQVFRPFLIGAIWPLSAIGLWALALALLARVTPASYVLLLR